MNTVHLPCEKYAFALYHAAWDYANEEGIGTLSLQP